MTLKLLIETGILQKKACCLIFEWRTDKRKPARALMPACSETLVCRVLITLVVINNIPHKGAVH